MLAFSISGFLVLDELFKTEQFRFVDGAIIVPYRGVDQREGGGKLRQEVLGSLGILLAGSARQLKGTRALRSVCGNFLWVCTGLMCRLVLGLVGVGPFEFCNLCGVNQ